MAAVRVGENSKIPNIGGIRKELVGKLRNCVPPWFAGRGDASPINTIGATASDRSGSTPIISTPSNISASAGSTTLADHRAGPWRRVHRRITLVNSDVRL